MSPSSPRRFPTTGGWISLAVIVGLVLVGISEGWFRDEWDSWKIASARQTWIEGDRDAAIDRLKPVVFHRTDRLDWLLDYARKAVELGRYSEALAASEAAQTLFESTGESKSRIAWEFVIVAAHSLVALDRGVEAVELCRPFAVDSPISDTADFLNGFAYVRALAGLELEQAEADVRKALKAFDWPPYDVSHRLALVALDASNWADASLWIDRAIGEFEPIHRRFLADFDDQIAILGADGDLQGDEVRNEIARWRNQREMMNRRRALMHSHRALIREGLQDSRRAEADRKVVRDAGFDPTAMAPLRFTDSDLLGYSAFLDTLAWIQFRMGKTKEALVTMDQAVEIADRGWQASEKLMRSTQQRVIRADDLVAEIEPMKRGIAALHQHRAEIYRANGDTSRAAIEERTIRELGFAPGAGLF